MTTALGTLAAYAQEPEPGPVAVEAGAFEVRLDDGSSISVAQYGLPQAVVIDPKFRTCRLSLQWTGEAVEPTLLDGCHPNLVDAVRGSLDDWSFELDPAPSREREIAEVWLVFPDSRGEGVRLFLRQSYDAELTLTADGLDVLPFRVEGQVFLEYPLEAVGIDTTITRCDVKVDVSSTGVPHGVVVSRCDEIFRASAEETLRRWRFGGNTLDGVPYQTAFTLGVAFTRQYDREDGKPGTAEVLVPEDPELGRVLRTREAIETQRQPPKDPTWDPLFVLDHKHFAEVEVYEMRWPEPSVADEDRVCPMLFQTNSDRLVWAWAEEGCSDDVRAAAEVAGNRWNLKHGDVDPGERYARFRGRLVFPADGGHVQLEVPADDLVTPSRALPEHVHTYADLRIVERVPPRLPRAFATEVVEPQLMCHLKVHVATSGKPDTVEPTECPDSIVPYAVKAVRRWKWRPAERDGKRTESDTEVSMRIDLSP